MKKSLLTFLASLFPISILNADITVINHCVDEIGVQFTYVGNKDCSGYSTKISAGQPKSFDLPSECKYLFSLSPPSPLNPFIEDVTDGVTIFCQPQQWTGFDVCDCNFSSTSVPSPEQR